MFPALALASSIPAAISCNSLIYQLDPSFLQSNMGMRCLKENEIGHYVLHKMLTSVLWLTKHLVGISCFLLLRSHHFPTAQFTEPNLIILHIFHSKATVVPQNSYISVSEVWSYSSSKQLEHFADIHEPSSVKTSYITM